MLDILTVDERDSSMKQRSHCAVDAKVLTMMNHLQKSPIYFFFLHQLLQRKLCKVLGVVTERK